VHHLTYARLGHEADEDLEVLCWLHHMAEHALWVECERCLMPVIGEAEDAEAWVRNFLVGDGIDLDAGPVDWARLPSKFAIEAPLPARCRACDPAAWAGL
jgi:hypothetical protein